MGEEEIENTTSFLRGTGFGFPLVNTATSTEYPFAYTSTKITFKTAGWVPAVEKKQNLGPRLSWNSLKKPSPRPEFQTVVYEWADTVLHGEYFMNPLL